MGERFLYYIRLLSYHLDGSLGYGLISNSLFHSSVSQESNASRWGTLSTFPNFYSIQGPVTLGSVGCEVPYNASAPPSLPLPPPLLCRPNLPPHPLSTSQPLTLCLSSFSASSPPFSLPAGVRSSVTRLPSGGGVRSSLTLTKCAHARHELLFVL